MKPNLGFYVQKINDVVQETEKIGETMNPYFVEIRTALDEDKVSELSTEKLTEVESIFTEGVAKYAEMFKTIQALRPPARVIGIHKKLEKAYGTYVTSCQAMATSIDAKAGAVDQAAFDASEKAQDEQTDVIAFCIQRMTGLLMK